MTNDTPRTDHALQGVWRRGDHGSAIPELCRELERENARLREALEGMLHLCEHDLGMDNESPYVSAANAALGLDSSA